jgi:hypothetical protein
MAVMPPMPMIGFDTNTVNQHVSAVLEFVPLMPLKDRNIYVPKEYKDLIIDIYAQFDVKICIETFDQDLQLQEATKLDIRVRYADAFAEIQVEEFGKDFFMLVEQTVRDLEEQGIQTIHIDLPIETDFTAKCRDNLSRLGFVFSGLLILFHKEQDYLRMQRTNVKLDFDKIVTYSNIANRIKSLIMKERS